MPAQAISFMTIGFKKTVIVCADDVAALPTVSYMPTAIEYVPFPSARSYEVLDVVATTTPSFSIALYEMSLAADDQVMFAVLPPDKQVLAVSE